MVSYKWTRAREIKVVTGMLMAFGLADVVSAQQEAATRGDEEHRKHEEVAKSLFRWQPVVWYGEFVGFRVYPGRAREGFFCLGLKPGDLVSAVDGAPFENFDSAVEVFYRIATKPAVVEIARENDPPKKINTRPCKSTG